MTAPNNSLDNFWCVTSFFNPAGYHNQVVNYQHFAAELKKVGVKLLTVELAYNDKYYLPAAENIIRLKASSVLWQKERLINYAVSQLPKECRFVAWLDCDIIFADKNWPFLAVQTLQQADIVQLFKVVHHLQPGDVTAAKKPLFSVDGMLAQCQWYGAAWQRLIRDKSIHFGNPGLAWAARREFFENGGLYDRSILGGGDTILAAGILNYPELFAGFYTYSQTFLDHVIIWLRLLAQKKLASSFLPLEIYHLWHGSL